MPILFLAALLSSVISGFVGMAGGVTLLAVMTLVLPFNVIVPIHGVVQLISNFTRSVFLYEDIKWKLITPYVLAIPFGGGLGYKLLSSIEKPQWVLGLIVVLLLYVVFKPKKIPEIKLENTGFFILGFAAAFLSCLVGATGPLLAPFFIRDDLSKKEIVATKSACQIFTHIIKIPVFLALSFPYLDHWELILGMVIMVIVGTKLGTMLLEKVSYKNFMIYLKIAMFVVAIHLSVKLIYFYS